MACASLSLTFLTHVASWPNLAGELVLGRRLYGLQWVSEAWADEDDWVGASAKRQAEREAKSKAQQTQASGNNLIGTVTQGAAAATKVAASVAIERSPQARLGQHPNRGLFIEPAREPALARGCRRPPKSCGG